MLNNLSIAKKFALGFGAILVLLVGFLVYSFYALILINKNVEQETAILRVATIASKLRTDGLRTIVILSQYTDISDQALIKELENNRALTIKESAELRKFTQNLEVVANLDAYETSRPRRIELADKIINAINRHAPPAEIESIRQEREVLDNESRSYLRRIEDIENKELEKAIESGKELRTTLQTNTVLAMSLIFFIIVVVSFWIVRSITKPLLALKESVLRIASLDFSSTTTTTTTTGSNDEMGQLAHAFNEMVDKLKSSYATLEQKVLDRTQDLARAKAKDEAMLASIGDGVVAIDRSFTIQLWNKTASRLTGWTQEEVLGKPLDGFLKFLRERDRKEGIEFIGDAMVEGEIRHTEEHMILATKDGREMPVGGSAAPIVDADRKVVGAIIVFRDASQEREAQRLRSDFAYAQHQLRTPVTKALGYMELALAESDRKVLMKNIRTAYTSLQSTAKFVDELVRVSEVDQGRAIPWKEDIDLAELTREVLGSFKEAARKARVVIEMPDVRAMHVISDSNLLKTILREIVGNAIIYNVVKGMVRVRVVPQDSGVLFEVQDTGIGITEEEQKIIFTKFFRGSNFNVTDVVGAGLGLYMSREYLKLLNGKIWFTSYPGKGTTFSVWIPSA